MRYIVTVRGTLKGSAEEARQVHDATVAKVSPMGKSMGSTSHQPYVNIQNGKDFLAIDFWDNLEGIQKLYSDPALGAEFAELFEGEPEVQIWSDTEWFQY